MATGIVSVVLLEAGLSAASRVLLVVAVLLWLALGLAFAWRLRFDRGRWRADARTVGSFTAVAGTAVIGVRALLLGWHWAGWIMLAVAGLLWLAIVPGVLVATARPAGGAAFLIAVAPQSLAVLAVALADRGGPHWVGWLALALFLVGLGLYGRALAIFDRRELQDGNGDHWVAGGALAISTLACAQLASSPVLQAGHGVLRVLTAVLWSLTIAWLVVLVLAEARWPRTGGTSERWATVFPLGMYAAMSFSTASALGAGWIADFARGCTWVAVAAWVATAAWSAVAVLGAAVC